MSIMQYTYAPGGIVCPHVEHSLNNSVGDMVVFLRGAVYPLDSARSTIDGVGDATDDFVDSSGGGSAVLVVAVVAYSVSSAAMSDDGDRAIFVCSGVVPMVVSLPNDAMLTKLFTQPKSSAALSTILQRRRSLHVLTYFIAWFTVYI